MKIEAIDNDIELKGTKVYYHGSPRNGAHPLGHPQNTQVKIAEDRVFFVTEEISYAENFARGGIVTEWVTSASQTIDLADEKTLEDLLERLDEIDPDAEGIRMLMGDPEDASDALDSGYFLLESKPLLAWLKSQGYDSARTYETVDPPVMSLAIFNPRKIHPHQSLPSLKDVSNKAVDAEGSALTLYHGTLDSFDAFSGDAPTRTSAGQPGVFFFSSDPQHASAYAGTNKGQSWNEAQKSYEPAFHGMQNGGNVLPVHLTVCNPLIVDAKERPYFDLESKNILQAQVLGYDGICFKDVTDTPGAHGSLSAYTADVWVVFDSSKIQSIFRRETDLDHRYLSGRNHQKVNSEIKRWCLDIQRSRAAMSLLEDLSPRSQEPKP